ncbi:branched-chain-amino acid aminotransferase [Candidatus Nitromaritima sp. SCGC AAA799-A02]|nr:branched-chain-amino acid aminotransferase [Candidatus Nitromaritima sp. SCGC AAA799-C22]KMP11234.1 branched-chain-amino acid aminotransferase [Candidatus Nitromaritima sp. SCGC AAA799-A02]
MTTRININGVIEEEAYISVMDHGFLFGDSIYEVVSTRGNRPCFLDEHLQRLRRSAEGIALTLPYEDEWFRREVERTLQAAGNQESYIRILVTRGVGEMDIDPSTCHSPGVMIFVAPAHVYPRELYENGIDLAVVSIKRNPRDALNPGIKTGNYLNNVLAKMEANRLGAHDALMLNPWGQLTESTTSNFFFVQEGRLLTPSLDCGILAGITRDMTIRMAQENGIPVEEGQWPVESLDKAEEMFLTGTVKQLMPVTRLDGKIIGNGKPGAITRRLMGLYENLLERLK